MNVLAVLEKQLNELLQLYGSVKNVILNLLLAHMSSGDYMYRCMKCKKDFEMEDNIIRCPFCGYRIISKGRETFRKHVGTR